MPNPSFSIDRETGAVTEQVAFNHTDAAARLITLCHALGWLHEDWEAVTGQPVTAPQRALATPTPDRH